MEGGRRADGSPRSPVIPPLFVDSCMQGRVVADWAQRSPPSPESQGTPNRAESFEADFPNFTREESRGKALFVRNCAACHFELQEVPFAVVQPRNNGTELDPLSSDGGLADITLNAQDAGRFKSPTLRNVEVAGPSMHNGSLATLDDVVEHYSRTFNRHPNLDFRMLRLDLTESEKAALVAFLKTLTDQAFLTDPRFS